VLDYLDDLASDFRVFYRVDDFDELSGPQFLSLAFRVSAYQGVMNARLSNQQQEASSNNSSSHRQEVKRVESTREALTKDPAFAGGISWGGG